MSDRWNTTDYFLLNQHIFYSNKNFVKKHLSYFHVKITTKYRFLKWLTLSWKNFQSSEWIRLSTWSYRFFKIVQASELVLASVTNLMGMTASMMMSRPLILLHSWSVCHFLSSSEMHVEHIGHWHLSRSKKRFAYLMCTWWKKNAAKFSVILIWFLLIWENWKR